MAKVQRDDRAFWLMAAKQAHQMACGKTVWGGFLCVEISLLSDQESVRRRRAQLDLFGTDDVAFGGGWWLEVYDEKDVEASGHAPASGRVLAACFLAAMAEAGDL